MRKASMNLQQLIRECVSEIIEEDYISNASSIDQLQKQRNTFIANKDYQSAKAIGEKIIAMLKQDPIQNMR